MIEPPPPAGNAGQTAIGNGPADRILRRASGSPGLVDTAALQAEVARKIGWVGKLFPLLPRLLARAAEAEADGFAGSAAPLASPFAFRLDDLLAPPAANPAASRFGDLVAEPARESRSTSSPSVDSPQRLVRVSRQVRPAGNAPTGTVNGAGMIALPQIPPSAIVQEIGAAREIGPAREIGATGEIRAVATIPAASPPRIVQSDRGREDGPAPTPLGRTPAPPPLGRSVARASPPVSQIASLPESPGQRPAPYPAPGAVPVGAGSSGREPGLGRGALVAVQPFSARAAIQPAIGAGETPFAHPRVVSELRIPRAARRSEVAAEPSSPAILSPPATGVNDGPLPRPRVVSELPRSGLAKAPMVLPAYFAEAPAPRPAASPATREPGAPNPPVMVGPRPAVPPAAPLAGAELERLAEKVSRVIARRIAVERERRGR